MNQYVVYYACPHCRKPCSSPMQEANELVEAQNKGEAWKIFQTYKPCRWMRIARIEKIEKEEIV